MLINLCALLNNFNSIGLGFFVQNTTLAARINGQKLKIELQSLTTHWLQLKTVNNDRANRELPLQKEFVSSYFYLLLTLQFIHSLTSENSFSTTFLWKLKIFITAYISSCDLASILTPFSNSCKVGHSIYNPSWVKYR